MKDGRTCELMLEGTILVARAGGEELSRARLIAPQQLPKPVGTNGIITHRIESIGLPAAVAARVEVLAVAARDADGRRLAAAQAALSAACPGLGELRSARERFSTARENYERAWSREEIAPRADAGEIERLAREYPRAALLLAAEAQEAGASWSDPTGKVAAAADCRRLLLAGAGLDECRAALAARKIGNVD